MPAENHAAPAESTMPRAPRRRKAKGADRPQYLAPGDIDQVMMMVVSLMGEVSALRERLDTHEALAEQGVAATAAAIEAFELSNQRRAAREEARQAMLKRVLRVVIAEREAVSSKPEAAARPE